MMPVLRVVLVCVAVLLPMRAVLASPSADWTAGWEQATGGQMVGAAKAAAVWKRGARVLDTRSVAAFEAGHLPGAVRVGPERILAAQSGQLVLVPALDAADGVLVVGKMGGRGAWWGEQGWLGMVLRSTGVAAVVALAEPSDIAEAAGVALVSGAAEEADWLRFVEVPQRREGVVALEEAVAAQRGGAMLFLDVRSRAEFEGATPFGEARGGHIAGARSAAWESLEGPDGWPLDVDRWRATVDAARSGATAPVAVYCTGGVRSGFVTFALRAMGVAAQNFEGSMWAWSADPSLPMATGASRQRDAGEAR